MKYLLCGCRDWTDDKAMLHWFLSNRVAFPDMVITGTRRSEKRAEKGLPQIGADRIAHDLSIRLSIPHKVIDAEWMKLGHSAGPIRNRLMLDEKPDLVVAFWDGASTGTKDTIDEANRRCVPVHIVRRDTCQQQLF